MRRLCVDVRNSQTTMGFFDGAELVEHWRVSTVDRRTADEWAVLVTALLDQSAVDADVDGVCVSSTVPAVVHELREMLTDYFADAQSLVVGPGVRTGLPVLVDNPREVGTDRIANALAAVALVGSPCIVVDFGVATTFEVVNPRGEYVGGAIAPGIVTSLEALGVRGAQLRQVELVTPRAVIAKNTVEALQSGAVFGFAGQADGVVRRMLAQLGSDDPVEVVATGESAHVVAEHCETVTRREPWLTLHGLRLIHERNT